MIGQSKQHVTATGESDGEHFRFATAVGLLAIAAGLAHPVRALFPALCTRPGSMIIARLYHRLGDRRSLEEVAQQSPGAIAFVGLVLLSATAAAPVVSGASFVFGVGIGAMSFAFPLAFALSDPELASAPAAARPEWLSRRRRIRCEAGPRFVRDDTPLIRRNARHARTAHPAGR